MSFFLSNGDNLLTDLREQFFHIFPETIGGILFPSCQADTVFILEHRSQVEARIKPFGI
jgi:hypothetical protein